MKIKLFSGSTIKIIAIVAMFLDHFGKIVLMNGIVLNAPYQAFSDSEFDLIFKTANICNVLGRIAFPIFCFLIVEGFIHTHDIKKYMIRLAIFCIISEPIYDLALSGTFINLEKQNVFFTLLLGLLTIVIIKKYNNNYLVAFLVTLVSAVISYYTRLDGWYYGIILIVIIYLFQEWHILKLVLAGITMYLCGLDFTLLGFISPHFLFALFSLLIIAMYNGKRGINLKYVFYIFYPAHLLILYFIAAFLVIPLYT